MSDEKGGAQREAAACRKYLDIWFLYRVDIGRPVLF